jgi:hypothetical protein
MVFLCSLFLSCKYLGNGLDAYDFVVRKCRIYWVLHAIKKVKQPNEQEIVHEVTNHQEFPEIKVEYKVIVELRSIRTSY